MKCLCGYEHEAGIDLDGKWNASLKGEEPFEKVVGTFFTECGCFEDKKEYKMFACPKCGTVKLSMFW